MWAGVVESTGEFASEQFENVETGLGNGSSTVKEKVGEAWSVLTSSNEKPRVH